MNDDNRTQAERDDAVIAAMRDCILNPTPPMTFESHVSKSSESSWSSGFTFHPTPDLFPLAAIRTIDRLRAALNDIANDLEGDAADFEQYGARWMGSGADYPKYLRSLATKAREARGNADD